MPQKESFKKCVRSQSDSLPYRHLMVMLMEVNPINVRLIAELL